LQSVAVDRQRRSSLNADPAFPHDATAEQFFHRENLKVSALNTSFVVDHLVHFACPTSITQHGRIHRYVARFLNDLPARALASSIALSCADAVATTQALITPTNSIKAALIPRRGTRIRFIPAPAGRLIRLRARKAPQPCQFQCTSKLFFEGAAVRPRRVNSSDVCLTSAIPQTATQMRKFQLSASRHQVGLRRQFRMRRLRASNAPSRPRRHIRKFDAEILKFCPVRERIHRRAQFTVPRITYALAPCM